VRCQLGSRPRFAACSEERPPSALSSPVGRDAASVLEIVLGGELVAQDCRTRRPAPRPLRQDSRSARTCRRMPMATDQDLKEQWARETGGMDHSTRQRRPAPATRWKRWVDQETRSLGNWCIPTSAATSAFARSGQAPFNGFAAVGQKPPLALQKRWETDQTRSPDRDRLSIRRSRPLKNSEKSWRCATLESNGALD
jgi:hypothetical protein